MPSAGFMLSAGFYALNWKHYKDETYPLRRNGMRSPGWNRSIHLIALMIHVCPSNLSLTTMSTISNTLFNLIDPKQSFKIMHYITSSYIFLEIQTLCDLYVVSCIDSPVHSYMTLFIVPSKMHQSTINMP